VEVRSFLHLEVADALDFLLVLLRIQSFLQEAIRILSILSYFLPGLRLVAVVLPVVALPVEVLLAVASLRVDCLRSLLLPCLLVLLGTLWAISYFTQLLLEAERESVNELVTLVEKISSKVFMTRHQELEAMLEVSTIIARMPNSSVDEVFKKLTQLSKSLTLY
jgi:hypothetical protein